MIEPSDYPSNSKKSRNASDRPTLTPIVKSEVTVKKPGVGDKIKQIFGGASMKRGIAVVIGTVVVPAVLDMSKDAIHTWVEGMFAGGDFDNVRRRNYSSSSWRGPNGQRFTDYSASALSSKHDSSRLRRPELGPGARERQDFQGELKLESRVEGELILDKLAWLVRDYGYASVKDMLELAGITAKFTDDKWGWTDLAGARVRPYGGQYVLQMPPTEPLE